MKIIAILITCCILTGCSDRFTSQQKVLMDKEAWSTYQNAGNLGIGFIPYYTAYKSAKKIATASLMGCITISLDTPEVFISVGRMLQRARQYPHAGHSHSRGRSHSTMDMKFRYRFEAAHRTNQRSSTLEVEVVSHDPAAIAAIERLLNARCAIIVERMLRLR